jgi:aminoglycoside phosphotransferase (APT) family kinase protein
MTYTANDWNFLIHPGEFEWKESWFELRADRAYWQPRIEWICRRHGIDAAREMTVEQGTNPAYLVGNVAIKVFVRRNPIWFPREVEALEVFSDYPAARTPRLIAWGDAIDGEPEHPYIIMERIEGRSYRHYRDDLSADQDHLVIRELATAVGAMHALPVARLKTFGDFRSEWAARMHARVEHAVARLAENLLPRLHGELRGYVDDRLGLITEEFEPTFLHSDIISGNIIISKTDGALALGGIIDFGDVEVGPVEYEWISLCMKAFLSDRERMSAFFTAYGIPYPFADDLRERLKLYTLLHRFTAIGYLEEEQAAAGSLDELLDRLWR